MAKAAVVKKPLGTGNTKVGHHIEGTNNYITPKGRATFVALANRSKNMAGSKAEKEGKPGGYVVAMIFPPESDLSVLIDAANAVGKEKFGKEFDGTTKKGLGSKKWPFRDPDSFDKPLVVLDKDGEEVDLSDWQCVRFNTFTAQPVVRDGTDPKVPVVDPDEIATECYSGRWMRLTCSPSAFDVDNGKGVKFYLNAVQLLKHDDPIGGGGQRDDGESFGAPVDDDDDGDGL